MYLRVLDIETKKVSIIDFDTYLGNLPKNFGIVEVVDDYSTERKLEDKKKILDKVTPEWYKRLENVINNRTQRKIEIPLKKYAEILGLDYNYVFDKYKSGKLDGVKKNSNGRLSIVVDEIFLLENKNNNERKGNEYTTVSNKPVEVSKPTNEHEKLIIENKLLKKRLLLMKQMIEVLLPTILEEEL